MLNRLESEAVYLLAVVELINSAVNRQVLQFRAPADRQEVVFESSLHRRYFSICLVDLLSQTDSRAPVIAQPYLRAIRNICEAPLLGDAESACALANAAAAFTAWLNETFEFDAWLPSIGINVKVVPTRIQMLKLCGDLSKHNFLRAIGVAEDIRDLLAAAGHEVDLFQALRAHEDVYDHFHENILAYHASTIAQHLNDLRWGIHEYLYPLYVRCRVDEGGESIMYRFEYPDGIDDPFARACFWDLMNGVRMAPYVPRFTASRFLQGRY
ncbi:MAG: hypothetical protein P4L83_20380 [Nevskia sp.]|nr:hypothetical protein [Nevskia sp.]